MKRNNCCFIFLISLSCLFCVINCYPEINKYRSKIVNKDYFKLYKNENIKPYTRHKISKDFVCLWHNKNARKLKYVIINSSQNYRLKHPVDIGVYKFYTSNDLLFYVLNIIHKYLNIDFVIKSNDPKRYDVKFKFVKKIQCSNCAGMWRPDLNEIQIEQLQLQNTNIIQVLKLITHEILHFLCLNHTNKKSIMNVNNMYDDDVRILEYYDVALLKTLWKDSAI